jgi:putative ABC transport system permease protein
VKLRVAGIWTKPNTNGYSVTVSPARFDELFGWQPPVSVYLRPVEGVSPEELVRRVEQARLDPDVYALTPVQLVSKLADELGQQIAPFWTLQRILLFVALVATLSTLLLVGVQRRRELGILSAVGFGPGGLMRMTVAEGAAAALAGGILGVLASLGVFEAFRNVAFAAVGAHPPFRFEFTPAITAVGLTFGVVVFGSLLPAWRTSRMQIVEALRDE